MQTCGDNRTSPPYPGELEERVEFRGRALLLRPIRADDADRHRQFLARVSHEDLRTRFFSSVREIPEPDLLHFTHIDYGREMAFIAVAVEGAEAGEILGVARACAVADSAAAEFALLVRSDLKRQGLGTLLMDKLIRYCRQHGTRELCGSVLSDNAAMLHLAQKLGFRVRRRALDIVEIALDLSAPPATGYTARESGAAPAAGGAAAR